MGQSLTLADKGQSSYVIVIGNDASPSELHGAGELQHFIKMISGAYLPIARENENVSAPIIFVGNSRRLKEMHGDLGIESCGDEEFIIKSIGQDLVLAGGRLRGSMYAVYAFLEDVLGCRWYTSQVSKIPRKDFIVLESLNVRDKPFFEYREPFWFDAFDADWAARNRCNNTYSRLDNRRGGKINYRGIHTFNKLMPGSRYLENHPEYFGIQEGKRQWKPSGTQVCLVNPEARKAMAQNVLDWIARDPEGTIFDVSQNDGRGNCQCERCLAMDLREGSPSGTLLNFINPIADVVKKHYPEKPISTFAYDYTLPPPNKIRPRDNIVIRLCTSIQCRTHPIETCTVNAAFRQNLETWGKIASKIYVWDYLTNFNNYLYPHPDIYAQIANIKSFAKNSVAGIYAQGDYTSLGAPEGYLKAYLEAKLMWNPYRNANEIISDFFEGYYGNSALSMRKYVNLLEDKVKNDNIHSGGAFPWNIAEYLTPEIINKAENALAEAARSAGSSDIAFRVEEAALPLRYVKLTMPRKHEIHNNLFTPVSDYNEPMSERELYDFMEVVEKHNITEFCEDNGKESMYQFILANIRTHRIVSINNDKIRLDFIPGLGGRLFKLIDKPTGRNLLYLASADDPWYPAAGGFAPGDWSNFDYTLSTSGGGQIIKMAALVPARGTQNYHTTRCEHAIELVNNELEFTVSTVMQPLQTTHRFHKYSSSPVFSLGQIEDLVFGYSDDGLKYTVRSLPAPDNKGISIWEKFTPEIKYANWGIFNVKEDVGIINSFTLDDVDMIRIAANNNKQSVQFALRTVSSMHKPEDVIQLKQSIKICHNIDKIIVREE